MHHMRNRWSSIAAYAVDVVYPKRCAACGRRGAWVCAECESRYLPFAKPWCDRCGIPAYGQHCNCASAPPGLNRVRSFGPFDGWLREAILQFKYDAEWARAQHLGPLLASSVADLPDVDVLVPVPLHAGRLRQRGFNQSLLLAKQISAAMNLPVEEQIVRTRRTQAQARLRGADRAANVADAFAVPFAERVNGRAVVLIDDVVTTGSTLAACAAAARTAGAVSVSAVTLAREM
jgi:ComF family protein